MSVFVLLWKHLSLKITSVWMKRKPKESKSVMFDNTLESSLSLLTVLMSSITRIGAFTRHFTYSSFERTRSVLPYFDNNEVKLKRDGEKYYACNII